MSQLDLAGVSCISSLYYPQTDLLFLSPFSHSTSLHELMTSESLYPTATLCCNQDVKTANDIVDNTIWMFHTIFKPVHLQLGSLILPYRIFLSLPQLISFYLCIALNKKIQNYCYSFIFLPNISSGFFQVLVNFNLKNILSSFFLSYSVHPHEDNFSNLKPRSGPASPYSAIQKPRANIVGF